MRRRYDAVVIGGGHNGLVAAAYLARAGQSVLVMERGGEVGGASTSAEVFPGQAARLSRYAYLVSLLPDRIVNDLDLDFSTRRRSVRDCAPLDGSGRHDALVRWTDDVERTRAAVERIAGSGDWRGLQRLSELEHALAQRVWPSLLQPMRSREDWVSSLDTVDEREAWAGFVDEPLGRVLERHVGNDILRGSLLTDGKIGLFTHAHDPSLLQNRCYLLHITGQGTGEWRVPVHGMGALVTALVSSARTAGAELVTEAAAEAVQLGPARHTVVFRLRHEEALREVEATRVLVNAGPQVFDSLLGRPHVDAAGDYGSVCKVNMLLSRLPELRSGVDPVTAFTGTFRLNESYSQLAESQREAAAGRIPTLPPAELYCHTLTDNTILGPELRQRGFQTLTLFGLDAPYHLFEHSRDASRDLLRRYFDSLNRHLAEPIEECLATDADGRPCFEVKTPVDLEQELALNRGNIFHRAPDWFFTDDTDAVGSWGVETPYDRLYRCGAGAERGGGVSGIPGHNAAKRIFQELGIGTGDGRWARA